MVDLYFTFWQYSPQSECANVPGAATPPTRRSGAGRGRLPLTGYIDQRLELYSPYYYQAAYQLGWYRALREPASATCCATPVPFVALNVRPAGAQADRLRQEGDARRRPLGPDRARRQMLYVYGGNDPWGAEPFECGKHAVKRECARYYVEGGTHGSRIGQLPAEEKAAATAMILDWAGLDPEGPGRERRSRRPASRRRTPSWTSSRTTCSAGVSDRLAHTTHGRGVPAGRQGRRVLCGDDGLLRLSSGARRLPACRPSDRRPTGRTDPGRRRVTARW